MNRIILFSLILLISCAKKKESQNAIITDTLAREENRGGRGEEEVSLDVSSHFLKSFKNEKNNAGLVLGKGKIYLQKGDSIAFPQEMEPDRIYDLIGSSDGIKIEMTVSQKNFSTVSYSFTIEDKGKKTKMAGEADLSPLFYIGTEMDEDGAIGYSSTEYWSRNSDCQFSIRLGNYKSELKARLKGCFDDKNYFLYLDKCPTLHLKKYN
jgi:hypothetical protein